MRRGVLKILLNPDEFWYGVRRQDMVEKSGQAFEIK